MFERCGRIAFCVLVIEAVSVAGCGGDDNETCYAYGNPTVEPPQDCLDVSVRSTDDNGCYAPRGSPADFIFSVSNGCTETFTVDVDVVAPPANPDRQPAIIEPGQSGDFHVLAGPADGFVKQEGSRTTVTFVAQLGSTPLVITASAEEVVSE